MKKQQSFATSPRTEINYTPKRYTNAEQLIFAAKFGGAVALVVLLLWLVEKYL